MLDANQTVTGLSPVRVTAYQLLTPKNIETMGDIAEQLIDGEIFGNYDEYGHPGKYNRKVCIPKKIRNKRSPSYIGIYHYLQDKPKVANYIIRAYALKHLKCSLEYSQIDKMADEIQKDFGAFVKWYKDNARSWSFEELKSLDTKIRNCE